MDHKLRKEITEYIEDSKGKINEIKLALGIINKVLKDIKYSINMK